MLSAADVQRYLLQSKCPCPLSSYGESLRPSERALKGRVFATWLGHESSGLGLLPPWKTPQTSLTPPVIWEHSEIYSLSPGEGLTSPERDRGGATILDSLLPEPWVTPAVRKPWRMKTLSLIPLVEPKETPEPPALGVRRSPQAKCFGIPEGGRTTGGLFNPLAGRPLGQTSLEPRAPFNVTTRRPSLPSQLSFLRLQECMTWHLSLLGPFLNPENCSPCPLKFTYPLCFELVSKCSSLLPALT